MKVPSHLSVWQGQMITAPETAQVLQNLLDEQCLTFSNETEFWDRLGRMGDPQNPSEAWDAAKNSVWETPALNRKRGTIPPGSFERLVRFSLPYKLPEMFPTLDIASSGLSIGAMNSASEAEIQELIDEVSATPYVQLQFLVWVAEVTPELDGARNRAEDLLDRLGLPPQYDFLRSHGFCVELRYDRSKLPLGTSLHVPGALDGIANEQFRPVTDCSARHGRTEPLNFSSGDGFPEAVHEGCSVEGFELKLLIR